MNAHHDYPCLYSWRLLVASFKCVSESPYWLIQSRKRSIKHPRLHHEFQYVLRLDRDHRHSSRTHKGNEQKRRDVKLKSWMISGNMELGFLTSLRLHLRLHFIPILRKITLWEILFLLIYVNMLTVGRFAGQHCKHIVGGAWTGKITKPPHRLSQVIVRYIIATRHAELLWLAKNLPESWLMTKSSMKRKIPSYGLVIWKPSPTPSPGFTTEKKNLLLSHQHNDIVQKDSQRCV